MRDADGIQSRQHPEAFWKLFRAGHFCVTHKNWNYFLVLTQRGFDFQANKVLRVFNPSFSIGAERINPATANYRQQNVGLRHFLFQDLHKILAGLNIVHIHKKVLRTESTQQAIEQTTRMSRIVAAAIADENATGHSVSAYTY